MTVTISFWFLTTMIFVVAILAAWIGYRGGFASGYDRCVEDKKPRRNAKGQFTRRYV